MIGIYIMGGLGNQMFQYACARSLSLRNKTDLYLDLRWFNLADTSSDRPYKLSNLKITPPPKEIKPTQLKLEKEISPFEFDSRFLTLPDNVYLYGYFAYEKYFHDYEKTLREDFRFQVPISEQSQIWEKKIRDDSMPVSIHVRRGDYLKGINPRIFHQIPMSYYERCIAILRENFSNLSLYIFSNDLDWCRKNFNFEIPTHFVDSNDEKNGYDDMFLMSLCRHHIIANSSFSFWGAWLDSRIGSLVFAPDRFQEEMHTDKTELNRLPKHWIVIES